MNWKEDSRVKIPAILHLTRLGYTYLSLKNLVWDESSNIVPSIFRESVKSLNPTATTQEINALLDQLILSLDNEDLGKQFFERLTESSGLKVIDFDAPQKNTYNVVTEYTCKKDDEEFRPDITLLINGLPLVFIEVKKPNNRDGMVAERERSVSRFKNPKFRRFINITQFMLFSNNMEYDDGSPEPLQGAFYAAPSYGEPAFNYFREEEKIDLAAVLRGEDAHTEDQVLRDNNIGSIKHTPEFATNKNPGTPTNRIMTSLLSRERLMFMLRYGIAYVKTEKRLEKHVMRYPQIFATKAIQKKLDAGIRKGIIWHTQGSGKTALAYYSVHFLSDYYRKLGIIPKFYFIVDRIDLLDQASREFRSRGLHVHTINSRDEFATDIKSNVAVHNNTGLAEITVVNIQRFKDDHDVTKNTDYALGLQRVYFLDEVHRSYNPQGSFLANLNQSDEKAVKIGLTGTPLLNAKVTGTKDEAGKPGPQVSYNSKHIFGDYIHKYYYNRSIADGYTLRLIREDIETKYRLKLKEALEEIRMLKDMGHRELVYSHPRFVEPMLDYIIQDFEESRVMKDDYTTGAMVICDSSDQAETMARIFNQKYSGEQPSQTKRTVKSCALILHDAGTKSDRKDLVETFKEGKIDILFVYNMLLTGFDAARLKKLYLGRVVKAHNLLQALTRVNRPYPGHRYGSVVDFVDIEAEFAKTNKDYFEELQNELGDELQGYSDLFKTEAEISADIEAIKDALFEYDIENAENFSHQVTQITDRSTMRKVVKALQDAKTLYNLIRLSGQYQLLTKLDFRKLAQLSTEAENHLVMINQREALENADESANLLNLALEDILFTFRKVNQAEMVIADQLREQLRSTREGLRNNFDQADPKFISLKDQLEQLFKKKNLSEISQDEMAANIKDLKDIQAKADEIERKNRLIRAKYSNDEKYARLHKRLLEKGEPTTNERKLCEALSAFKAEIDSRISQNAQILNNEAYAKQEVTRLIIELFQTKHQLPLTPSSILLINNLVMKEYMAEFHGHTAA